MLVLTRKNKEQIRIADNIANNIIVTIVKIRGGNVKLGIECPRKIPIHRNEVPIETLDESESFLTLQFGNQKHFIL
ncbi:carbon storage regulator [Gimesia algae]|uniref:Translational regulator CsrA n=1 Tax=Gimesia algae TaxID=2527971 RepID=A0A517VF06_9PLAN|nr:carbon storage regulator [Gimesia algae]QDT91557.1 hypothetical protein Pan161_32160 [Gimesia algae]